MKHNLSPKVVNEIVTNIRTDYHNSSNHWWIKLINNRLWISLWMITTIIAAITIIASISISKSSFFKKPFIIIGIIVFITGCFLLVQSFVLKIKIREKLLEDLPIISYYQLAINDNNPQMNLITISDYWTIEPQGNLPLDEEPTYYNYCEQVMFGNINGQNFNYGSIINQKVVYDTSSGYNSAAQIIETVKTTCYYTRFVYYTTIIIRNNNFTMTLTPRNIFSKKFCSKNKVQLESNLFEDLFEVKCDNQIKLRLILEPKVMNLMNEFAYSLQNKDLPVIHIENEQLTLSWKYELGKNPYNDKGKLMVVPTSTNFEKFINKLLIMLNEDILNLTQAQIWVNNLCLLA